MPRGQYFSFQVYTGKHAVDELGPIDGKIFIETDLNVNGVSYNKTETIRTSHGEYESQSWPVTPYMVKISIEHHRDSNTWYWFEMFIDGLLVWNKPLKNGRNFTVEGTFDKKAQVFREFLFSLPRYTQSKDDRIDEKRIAEIGSIKVICKEAIFDGYRRITFHQRDESERGTGSTRSSDFHQATKADCATAGNAGYTTTTTGRELFRFSQHCGGKEGSQMRFRRGCFLEEVGVHYRMKDTLRNVILCEKNKSSSLKKENRATLKNDKVNGNNEKSSMEALEGIMTGLTMKSEKGGIELKKSKSDRHELFIQPIRTRVTEEIIIKKNEKGEETKMTRRVESMPLERYIRVDDDIYIVESLDDSVVLIGDDDCYIVQPPVKEFPFVELE